MRPTLLAAVVCGLSASTSAVATPGPLLVEVPSIQGRGTTSPLVGLTVTTSRNVVTARAPNGFFLQTPDERDDGDPETSNAVFVYTAAAPPVTIGQLVDVQGEVQEFFGLTEIARPRVRVVGRARTLPAAVRWDETTPSARAPTAESAFERFEGMLISFSGGVVCQARDRYGEYVAVAGPRRAFREPGIRFPGLPGLPVWDGNPELFEIVPDGIGHPGFDVPAGTAIRHCYGVVSFAFGSYQVLPLTIDVDGAMAPTPVPDARVDELTIATWNLHDLFDDRDDPERRDDVLSTAELELRLSKRALAIVELLRAPDILCVQEVETARVLDALAERIAGTEPALSYRAHLLGGDDPGGRNTGFLLGERVSVLAVFPIGTRETFVGDDGPRPLFPRPPLVLDARWRTSAAALELRIVNVHLRSLIGIEEEPAVRALRFAQASWLASRLDELQDAAPGGRLVLAGDLNAYPFSDGYVDVVGILAGTPDPRGAQREAPPAVHPPLENVLARIPADERYSTVYAGSAAALDHILVSRALGDLVSGAAFARVGADFPVALASSGDNAMRASDHDALVVRIRPPVPFVRGDVDASGSAELADALAIVARLFGGRPSGDCPAAGDVDGDGELRLVDAIRLLHYLFAGGAPPAAPHPSCGPGPAGAACASFVACE